MSNLIKLNIIAPGRGPITEEIISLITENSSGQIEFTERAYTNYK